jgi:hypothetical protein
VLAIVAASWVEHGKAAEAETLRNAVVQALTEPQIQTPRLPSSEQVSLRPTTDLFEIAYATTRVWHRLSRGDIEGAEAFAQSTVQRFGWISDIFDAMIDHYLATGEWSRADAWHGRKRQILGERAPGPDDQFGQRWEAQTLVELDYQLNVAAGAIKLGETSVGGSALERVRSISCARARASAYHRDDWSVFLRRAYLLKAFQEGLLPSYALNLQF